MGAAYFKAAIPEPHRILGQRLKPFSLGHWIILARFNSPFVGDNQDAQIARDDLVFAVLVCTMSYDEFFKFIERDDWEELVTTWGQNCGVFDLHAKSLAFQSYIVEGTKWPEFWQEDTGHGRSSGTHWSQTVLLTLTSKLHYTQDQALNMPFTKSISDFLHYLETQGAVRLMTDDEMAFIEQSKQAEAVNGT